MFRQSERCAVVGCAAWAGGTAHGGTHMDPVAAAGWVILVVGVVLAGALWRAARQRGGSVGLAAASAIAFASGFIVAGLGTGHLAGVAITELRRSPPGYDFRVYGLVLLGGVLVTLGASLALAAAGMTRGDRRARRRGIVAAVMLLIVNAPLAPIQGFAVAVFIFAAIGLFALLALGSRT